MSVSVIIPSTDFKKAFQALESILQQELAAADEIIIVGRNIQGLADTLNGKIKIINTAGWVNAATARNIGAKSASGDILLFIDDDCLAGNNWIQSNIKALSVDDKVAAVTGRIEGKSSRYISRCVDLSGFWVQQNRIKRYVDSGYAATLGINRALFEQIGGFDQTKDMTEDCDLYAKIINSGYKVLYDPQISVFHNHGRDTLLKMISFMYEGGRNYRRYFCPNKNLIPLVLRIPHALAAGFSSLLRSLSLNKGIYPNQFLYIPGMFIGFFVWYLGQNSGLGIRKNLDNLIFFITGNCNLKCAHCFYWTRLNKSDDLSLEQIKEAFSSFGKIKSLLLSGGEPFLRKDIVQICRFFRDGLGVEFLSIPTNGSMPEVVALKTEEILRQLDINITVGLSLDGMKEYHDELRSKEGAFDSAIKTYEKLALLKEKYPSLTITVNPVITVNNTDEVIKLAEFVKERMPGVGHFWFSIVRGDTRSCAQVIPDPKILFNVYKEIEDRFYRGRVISLFQRKIWNLLFSLKIKVLQERKQIIPCVAGESIAVLDSNGDVRACELREPFGNIKEKKFLNIWNSYLADLMRKSIKHKVCFCTHECFIYPSLMKAIKSNPFVWLKIKKGRLDEK